MRRLHQVAIIAAIASAAVLGSAGVASAAINVDFDYTDYLCNGDTDTADVDIEVTITGDAAEDTFDIVFSGVEGLDPDPNLLGVSGGFHSVALSDLEDGVLTVVVTNAVTDEEYGRLEVAITCGLPVVLVDTVCDGGQGFIRVAPLTQEKITFDIGIDEDVVSEGVPGFEVLDYYIYGPFETGEYAVSVMRLDTEAEPWLFYVDVDCTDDGSGAGIPDAGANTGTLVFIAGGLVLLGGALVLARRTRLA